MLYFLDDLQVVFKLAHDTIESFPSEEKISFLLFEFNVVSSNYHVFIRLVMKVMAVLNRMVSALACPAFHIRKL